MHTELALIVLAATILVALSQLQWPRPAPLRQSRPPSRRADEERRPPSAGRGLAGQIAWLGMAAATLACLGHFALPVADPLWLALIAAAIATAPAAFFAPKLQLWRRRRARTGQRSRAARAPRYEQPEEREQNDGGTRE